MNFSDKSLCHLLKILSLLPHNSQSLAFTQLGANDGMHFLGPIRGVLPLGPNGVASLNTLQLSPFDTNAEAMISYNYTLNQQGFASDITCEYDNQSPINFTAVPGNPLMVAYNASCPDLGLASVLTNVVDYPTPNTNNTLTFWACKSAQEPTYHVYLRGRIKYAPIANITCIVSSIQPEIFPVEYQSAPNIFSSKEPNASFANAPLANATPGLILIEHALGGLGAVIQESQNIQSNLVAESVITFGVKNFKLEPYERNEKYLRLYEAMIKGILEYEVCLVNSSFLSFAHRLLIGHLHSVAIFDHLQPPFFLYSHIDRFRELPNTRLVCGVQEPWLFGANDNSQLGFLGHYPRSHVQSENWWL